MKHFLLSTAGIALTLLLAGCPTGSDTDDPVKLFSVTLTPEGANVDGSGNPTETVSASSTTDIKEGDTITLTVAGLDTDRQVSFSAMLSDGITAIDFTPAVLRDDGEVTFIMPAEDVDITAAFAPIPTYAVTLTPVDANEDGSGNPTETVSASSTTDIKEGDTVTLTVAGLDTDRQVSFSAMLSDGITPIDFTQDVLRDDGDVTFTMPAEDVTITATFAPIPTYALMVTPEDANEDGSGNPTETVSASSTNEAKEGEIITLTVEGLGNDRQVSFSAMLSDGITPIDFTPAVLRANGETASFTMPAEDVTITATFAPIPTYALMVTPEDANEDGSGNPTETVSASSTNEAKEGAIITLKVEGLPTDGSRKVTLSSDSGNIMFSNTEATPSEIGTTPTINANGEVTFTMPAEDVNITAAFDDVSFNLSVTPDGNGTGETVTINDTLTTAKKGDTITLTVAGLPTDGSRKVTLSSDSGNIMFSNTEATPSEIGNEPTIKANGEVTFIMPAEDVNITADFDDVSFNLSVTPTGQDTGETVTINDTLTTAKKDDTITLTVAGLPTDGSRKVTLSSDSGNIMFSNTEATPSEIGTTPTINANGEVTFIMPAEDVNITAAFDDVSFNLSVTPTGQDIGETATINGALTSTAKKGDTITLTVENLGTDRQVSFSAMRSDGITPIDFIPAVLKSNEETSSFTMPAEDVTITAAFAPIPTYTLMVSTPGANSTETVSPSTTTSIKEGDIITLTVAGLPTNGSRKVTLSSGSGNIVFSNTEAIPNEIGTTLRVVANEAVTFTMPAENVNITATFAPAASFSLLVNKNPGSNSNETVNFDINPNFQMFEGSRVTLTVRNLQPGRKVSFTSQDVKSFFNTEGNSLNYPPTILGTDTNRIVIFIMPAQQVDIMATFSDG